MHQSDPSNACHSTDCGLWLLGRQGWLACLGLLWSLGLALTLFQAQPGHAETVLLPVVIMPLDVSVQHSGAERMLASCVEKQLDRSCADAEANDLADPELPSSHRLSPLVVQVLFPTVVVHGPLAPGWVLPLLRPPRSTG